jgi:hypothetical protein
MFKCGKKNLKRGLALVLSLCFRQKVGYKNSFGANLLTQSIGGDFEHLLNPPKENDIIAIDLKRKKALYIVLKDVSFSHRYQKSLNRLLKVCYVPATSAVLIAFFSSFFAVAINSNDEANKAAGTGC